METVIGTRSFDNPDDWLEGFRCDTGLEMRKGRLDALLNAKNFEDQTGLKKLSATNTQLWYICEAISLRRVKKPTIEYGFDLIFKWIRAPFHNWQRGVKKETVFRILSLLRKHNVPNVKSVHINPDLLRDFLKILLFTYVPQKNSAKETSDIIETVFALGYSGYFSISSYWKGHSVVIEAFIKRTEETPNPFVKDAKYGNSLAIHLAAAGDLTAALKRRRKNMLASKS